MQKIDNSPPPDPDQPMHGTCPTCGGRVVTTRGQCEEMADGFGGKAPHAMCPNKFEGQCLDTAVVKLCGRRIRMSPVEEW